MFINIAVEDLVRLPYLRTSGRTEEITLTRPCVNLKKRLDLKVHAKWVLGLEFVNEDL